MKPGAATGCHILLKIFPPALPKSLNEAYTASGIGIDPGTTKSLTIFVAIPRGQ
jgi:hypothetical protein